MPAGRAGICRRDFTRLGGALLLGGFLTLAMGLRQRERLMAQELAPHSIRVNTVHPTTVATDVILNEAIFRLFWPDFDNPGRAGPPVPSEGPHRARVVRHL
jgi:hypothetical protein